MNKVDLGTAKGVLELFYPLLGLLSVAFAMSFPEGAAYGRSRAQIERSFERDALMRRSSQALADVYHGYLFWGDKRELARRIEMLRESKWGPFAVAGERRVARLAALNRPLFPMISPAPYHVQSAVEVRTVEAAGREVLVIHAPGAMRIRIEPGRYRLRHRRFWHRQAAAAEAKIEYHPAGADPRPRDATP